MARRRKLRWLLVSLPLSVGVGLIIGGCGLTCRPGWYQPVTIDYARLDQDKRSFHRTVEKINVALNERRPVEIVLDSEQVNRWIAARAELPDDYVSRVELEGARDPQVMFLDGNRVRLAALVERSGFAVVISCDLRLELEGGELVLTWDGAGAGALPIPRRLVERAAAGLLGADESVDALIRRGRAALPNDWVWPNGKARYRIRSLSVEDGLLRMTLEPP